MTTRRILRNTVVLTLAATLAACGGGESGTGFDGGTATSIHSGVITGFGSVYVTGIEFMTPATTFTLDGRSGSENQLAVGMDTGTDAVDRNAEPVAHNLAHLRRNCFHQQGEGTGLLDGFRV